MSGVSGPVGSRWFREGGGMPPLTLEEPSERYLRFAEREEIAVLRAQRLGVREIARLTGRSPSTISRELRRNAATRGGGMVYRASTAQWHADRAGRRPKVAKLAANERLKGYVTERLSGMVTDGEGRPIPGPNVPWKGRRHGRRADRRWGTAWSPEQISNRLRSDFPDDESMRISHEAIYQALYVQGRGALRRELSACLRTGRALRVPQARTQGRGKHFVTDEVKISQRPAEVADRAVPGHWEGDLILGLDSAAGTSPGTCAHVHKRRSEPCQRPRPSTRDRPCPPAWLPHWLPARAPARSLLQGGCEGAGRPARSPEVAGHSRCDSVLWHPPLLLLSPCYWHAGGTLACS